VVSLSLPRGI